MSMIKMEEQPLYPLPSPCANHASTGRNEPSSRPTSRDSKMAEHRHSLLQPGVRSSVYSGHKVAMYSKRREENTRPNEADLRLFVKHCHLFYFDQNPPEESSLYISNKLATLDPSQRAAYAKVQSSLRSLAHLHHLRVRISSFYAQVSAIQPSCSLSPASRGSLISLSAKTERRQHMHGFIRKWCNVGTEPFFRGLWAALHVQCLNERDGGAGGKRVVWEIDDAVFQELGGPEFLQDAVNVIKGVLGFSDTPLSEPPRFTRLRADCPAFVEPTTTVFPCRSRAISDPFLDERTAKLTPPVPPRPCETQNLDQRPLLDQYQCQPPGDSNDLADQEDELNARRFRLWLFPAHIDNEEATTLLAMFPRTVRRNPPRLSSSIPNSDPSRAEEGATTAWAKVKIGGQEVKVPRPEQEDTRGVIRVGTGRLWKGIQDRDPGWSGSGWYRFIQWCKRLFSMFAI